MTDAITPQAAAQELLARRRARRDLAAFTQYTRPGWIAANVHRQLCTQLERVQRREVDRLAITLPPQHGKSTVSSKSFPAWSLGLNAHQDVAVISATESLATEFGRDVRNTVAGRECRNVFPDLALAADSQAAGRWHTDQGGSFLSLGIGGQFFGRGANLAVIDDPFATWEDAQSEIERARVADWYDGTLYNRVRPGGAIVLIQHRLHEQDLIGVLAERATFGADQFDVVNLKASPDLWPERYTQEALDRIQANMHPLKWSALYMQNPLPDEGTFFKLAHLPLVSADDVPKGAHKYVSGDFAVTDGSGDSTDIATHAYAGGVVYLALDGWHGQKTADVWIETLIDQVERHRPFAFFGEGGVIRRSIEPFLTRRMLERRHVVPCEWITRSKDKPTCARSLQGLAALGKVKIVDGEYGRHLRAQMLKFPGGKDDDAVDMAVNFAMAIDQAHPSILPSPPKVPEAPRGARTFAEAIARHEQRGNVRERI